MLILGGGAQSIGLYAAGWPSPTAPQPSTTSHACDAEAYSAETENNVLNAYCARPAVIALAGDVAGRRILDAGCGAGALSAELCDRGASSPAHGAQTTRDQGVLIVRKLIALVFNYSLDGLLADEGTEFWKLPAARLFAPATDAPHVTSD